jgi:hypothetical protein
VRHKKKKKFSVFIIFFLFFIPTGTRSRNRAISQEFLNFLYMIFGGYERYLSAGEASKPSEGKFDFQKFRESKPKDVQQV